MLRVRELLKRELSVILQRDYSVDGVLATINDVEVTTDLRQGRVFIGLIGDGRKGERLLRRLNSEHGAIQQKMSKRVVLRYTPQLQFEKDDSVERGVQVLSLLQKLDELSPPADSGTENDGAVE